MNTQQKMLLGGIGLLSYLDGFLSQAFIETNYTSISGIPVTIIYSLLIFIWYHIDSTQIGYKRSIILNIAVVGIAIFALPYYFFRSRGFIKGMQYTLFLILALIVVVLISFAGRYTAAFFTGSEVFIW